MTVQELIKQLEDLEDKSLNVEVSVDMSTCEDNADYRVYGDTLHVLNQGNFITIICENRKDNY